MNYDPEERKVNVRQILAGWILCVAMIGVAYAATGHRHAIPAAPAGPAHVTAVMHRPSDGARLPHFAWCAPQRQDGTVRMARGPMPLAADSCG